jgi:RNA polymerase I-specific transcription initiation factor RRN7
MASQLELDPLSDSESQMFSSQGSGDAMGSSTEETTTSHLTRVPSTPKLLQSLALCFMGVHLLKLPITLGDFLKWVKSGELLYYRAIKSIPKHMIDRLPGQYHPFLDPQDTLSPDTLHRAVTGTIVRYQKEFDMSLPPMNVALHLFRYIEELALPVEVYTSAKRVGNFASFGFTYPEQKGTKFRIVDFPDGQLAAAVIVSVKMLYPFDSIKRYPRHGGDPAGAVMNWDAWEKARKRYADSTRQDERLEWEVAMKVTENDVLNMSDTNIDDYLDYFAKTWTIADPEDKDKDADYRRAMLDLFPIIPNTQPPPAPIDVSGLQSEMIKSVTAALIPRRVITEEQEEELGKTVQRPGSLYKRYRAEKDLEGHAKVFYQAVADLAGISLKSAVRAVYITENHILREHEEAELRKQYKSRKEGKKKQNEEDEMDSD